MHFDCAGSHEIGSAPGLFRGISFYKHAVVVFGAMSISRGRRGAPVPFGGPKRFQTSFCATGAGHRALGAKTWKACDFWQVAKTLAWVKMRRAFGSHFSWQGQYLVNFDDTVQNRVL